LGKLPDGQLSTPNKIPQETLLIKIPPLGTPVRVDWFDSVDAPGWHYFAPNEKPNFGLRLPMTTRGILVAEDSLSISIAPTIAPQGPEDTQVGYMDVLAIPKGCVIVVKVIP
jgi:hypothetical protein